MQITKLTLLACLLAPALSNAQVSEGDAKVLFSTAVSTALTFKNERMIDEIGASFTHFTQSGREQLLNEMDRTGVIEQAAQNNGSLSTALTPASVSSLRRDGPRGEVSFDMSAEVSLQWQRCVVRTCVPVGAPKPARVAGTVIAVTSNGRPSYKVSSFRLDGAAQQ